MVHVHEPDELSLKALTFRIELPRLAFAKVFGVFSPRAYVSGLGPMSFENVAEPKPFGDDWVMVQPSLAGICGSDLMQVFLAAAADNPLSAVVSAPHVMGHEVVGTVVDVGSAVKGFAKDDRVAVSPWLSCAPRGLPPCPSCAARATSRSARNFFDGKFARGMHLGNCREVSGGFAETMCLHESMLFPIPEGVSFDDAVLADPFAVSLHAVLRAPPEPGETVLVYGCGSLGLDRRSTSCPCSFPACASSRWTRSRAGPLVEKLGATKLFTSRGKELVAEIGEYLKVARCASRTSACRGSRRASTRSTTRSARRRRSRSACASPGRARRSSWSASSSRSRFEWTPLYFKEIALLGSNAYGMRGRRRKARARDRAFPRSAREEKLSLDGLVTHRFPLEKFGDAFMAVYDKRSSSAIKVVFDPRQNA